MNSIEDSNHESYIRLNSLLPSGEPSIDNIDRMSDMRESVYTPDITRACEEALYALIMSAFYFELTDLPEHNREGQYYYRGTIRCRIPGSIVVSLLRTM